MANLPPLAAVDTPMVHDPVYGTAPANGTINVGDFLIFSGHNVVATAMAAAGAAAGKASAAGIALEASPLYDSHGVEKTNTALLYARLNTRLRVSAFNNITASAGITLGTPVYPATTGSGVNQRTGITGVGAQWATAARVVNSAYSGAAPLGIGVVVGVAKLAAGFGATGSGVAQLDVVLFPPALDFL